MLEEWIDRLREHKLVILILLVIAGLVALLFFNQAPKSPKTELPDLTSTEVSSAVSTSSSRKEESNTIVVDVKGAVKKAGVYELPADSRVTDAIQKAGGFADNANQNSVNLAQKLSDEAVVYVAAEGEETQEVTGSAPAGKQQEASGSQAKVNLNTATKEDLQGLSGIGEKRAQDIIDYREEHGGFKSVEELKNISGIGEKTYEKLAAEVTV